MTDGAPTLRDVAKEVLATHGGSGRDLDRKARRQGLRIAYTTINSLAAGTYTSRPSIKTLDALAALSATYSRDDVYRAAQRPLPRAPLAARLPDGADSLLPEQEAAVLAVIRQFAAANSRLAEQQESDDGTPMNDLDRAHLAQRAAQDEPAASVARKAAIKRETPSVSPKP